MDKRMLPIGIEDFAELRREGCYYIDKTEMIPELLEKKYKVSLITRPRRFGKTLLMSMLAEFFDITKDSSDIFEGLDVLRRKDLCALWMNRWPVLFLTLKNVEGLNFEGAYGLLKKLLSAICKDHAYLADSSYVDADDRKSFLKLKAGEGDEAEVKSFLDTLMRMMAAHFGKPVILLLDEYDVPLSKASENGYYVQMLDIIRSMLGIALKSNRFLKFAVITGCLRIAKESIFTGTNNFVSCSIADYRFQEYFGFTEEEVIRMLGDYSLSGSAKQLKAWYDGYCFGNQALYCPWDVLNYMGDLQSNPAAKPGNYWKNTSHNNIIRSFVGRMDFSVNEKFEALLEGQSIREKICEDLTYDVLHSSESNFWSILYLTGYLTRDRERISDGDEIWLKIPNEEIRSIFRETVLEWFQESMEVRDRRGLFTALWSGDEAAATEMISDILFNTISYYDYKESYYHAFTAGLFSGAGYRVESNYEYDLGRPDIVVKDAKNRRVLIVEVKYSSGQEQLEPDCQNALKQIDVKEYAGKFLNGYREVICYGAAFYRKQCLFRKWEK